MFRELWQLIKLLFQTKPSEVNEVELLEMKYFPFKGYKYLMWCGKMIYRNDMIEKRKKEWKTLTFLTSKVHETIHLNQAKRSGSWAKYYWQYFKEWIKGGIIMAPVSSAYYTNPFEMEAFANERFSSYPREMTIDKDNYSVEAFTRYIIKKGRKKLYKSLGKTGWKKYIKTL